jgi:Right handed beta helix region
VRSKLQGVAIAVAASACLIAAPAALAHIERASYWPDPRPDTSIKPAAGGKVPKTRSLASALDKKAPGHTRVVCAANSMRLLKRDLRIAKKRGFKLRLSGKRKHIGRKKAKNLFEINKKLRRRCKFNSIQDAVDAAGNNDRVVIMPGIYTEPESRAAPTHDPKCADLVQENDKGNPQALSYAYHLRCPNDQSLVNISGRANGSGSDPQPPLQNRRGIPNLGKCVKCNLQMEGSGPTPNDVVVDAGRVESGNIGPVGDVKDVGIRADRADGFVLRNLTVRHAGEHGIYVLETDGYRLERFKAFFNADYGVLTFVADHGLMQKCEAAGSGDSGLYPGAAAETGEQTIESRPRYNQEIRYCDLRHNTAGYSGTDGNAVWLHNNNFYDNANGFTTDVFTASGHPGFPQDSDLLEHNKFYSNNFNPYDTKTSDVRPTTTMPVGTGMWIAGGNNNIIRNNYFFDNWRRGTMLFSVPNVIICPTPDPPEIPGCHPTDISTSHRNQFYGNHMGTTPKGKRRPNGLDFWWDASNGNKNDCWFNNKGANGTPASITSIPAALPSNCATSIGTGGTDGQTTELLNCVDVPYDTPGCPWFTTPPKPNP